MKLVILSLFFVSSILASDAVEFQSRALIELSSRYKPSVEDLEQILDEPKFLKEVLESTTVGPEALQREMQQLRGQISVEKDETTEQVMIVLTVRATGKEETTRLATKVANVFADFIHQDELARAEQELAELDRKLQKQNEIVRKKREVLDKLLKDIEQRAESRKPEEDAQNGSEQDAALKSQGVE